MRRILLGVLTLLAAGLAGWLTTRLQPGLVAGLVVLAGAAVVLAWPVNARWGDWWFWYRRYLNSRRWHRLSWQVKERDRWTCQRCKRQSRKATVFWEDFLYRVIAGIQPAEDIEMHAHHLPGTYRKWWWYALRLPERKRDLVTYCEECHQQEHGR